MGLKNDNNLWNAAQNCIPIIEITIKSPMRRAQAVYQVRYLNRQTRCLVVVRAEMPSQGEISVTELGSSGDLPLDDSRGGNKTREGRQICKGQSRG